MTMFIKNTHKLILFLRTKCFSKDQAKGFPEAVKSFDTKELATKSDLSHLRLDLTKTISAMILGQIAVQTGLLIAVIELFLR